jgi:hypothetical protein
MGSMKGRLQQVLCFVLLMLGNDVGSCEEENLEKQSSYQFDAVQNGDGNESVSCCVQ